MKEQIKDCINVMMLEKNEAALEFKFNDLDGKEIYHQLIKLQKSGKDHFFTFVMGDKDRIGKGTYGSAYKAYSVDKISGDVSEKEFIVVKAIELISGKTSYQECVDEYKSGYMHIPMYHPIQLGRFVFLPQEYLGKELAKCEEEVKNLSQEQFFKIALDLIYKFQDMHNFTMRCSFITIHFDIKAQNILVNFEKGEAWAIDFGLSRKYYDIDDSKQIIGHADERTYASPEVKQKNATFTTQLDIYPLGAVLAFLLGDTVDISRDNCYLLRTHYTIGNLPNLERFGFEPDTKKHIVNFLNRMRHIKPEERPDITETLYFINTLNNYQKQKDPALALKLQALSEQSGQRQYHTALTAESKQWTEPLVVSGGLKTATPYIDALRSEGAVCQQRFAKDQGTKRFFGEYQDRGKNQRKRMLCAALGTLKLCATAQEVEDVLRIVVKFPFMQYVARKGKEIQASDKYLFPDGRTHVSTGLLVFIALCREQQGYMAALTTVASSQTSSRPLTLSSASKGALIKSLRDAYEYSGKSKQESLEMADKHVKAVTGAEPKADSAPATLSSS